MSPKTLVAALISGLFGCYILILLWGAKKSSRPKVDFVGLPIKHCTNDERLMHLRERCKIWRGRKPPKFTINFQSNVTNYYWRLLVDDKHKTLYCVIPKVACTTWKSIMANMTGKLEEWKSAVPFNVHNVDHMKSLGLTYLSGYTMNQIHYKLKNYYKYIIVRHPLDRIMSAYADKVVGSKRYFKDLIPYIIKKFRHKPRSTSSPDEGLISLEEFVAFIGTEYPRFPDRHYISAFDMCHPCDIDYDFIAKVETFGRDARALFKKIYNRNVTDDILNQKLNSRQTSSISRLKVLDEYNDLSIRWKTKLIETFAPDFDLFGYKMGPNNEVVCQSNKQFCC